MREATPNTTLCFGKYKGRKLKDVPPSYVEWMVEKLKDTTLHHWWVLADQMIKERQKDQPLLDLEKEADRILREAGCGYLVPNNRKNRPPFRR